MAWTKPTNVTSWSYSRYSAYRQCPFKLKMTAIERVKEPGSPAMERGNEIHKLAEAFIKGGGRKLPDELGYFPNFFRSARAAFKKGLVSVEETWAFRRDWTMTTWDDWTGCWLRVKVDVAWINGTTVSVVDHKTGKYSPQWNLDDYVEQLDLYALAALIRYASVGPDLRVVPRLHYLDHEVVHPEPGQEKIYAPGDLPALKAAWEARVRPMMADTTFAPKANRFCGSCFFRKDNRVNGGGQCKL